MTPTQRPIQPKTARERAFEAVQVAMPASWVNNPDGETMSPKAVKVAEYFARIIEEAERSASASLRESNKELVAALRICRIELEEHNSEYQHRTSDEFLSKIAALTKATEGRDGAAPTLAKE